MTILLTIVLVIGAAMIGTAAYAGYLHHEIQKKRRK